MTSSPAARPRERILERAVQPVILLAIMWAVRAADTIIPGSWNRALGIVSWQFSGLDGVIASPLLHSGWPHLIANSAPFAVLGILVAFDGVRRFWAVTAIAAVVGGLGTWVVNVPGTVTVGASGLVFGYFGYLLVRAFVARSLGHGILYAAVAIAAAVVYGGAMFTGIFGAASGISWQAHLFGAIGGAVAAVALRPRRDQSAPRSGV
ncbi:rhomboid family intramembrane serine protease [Microbacterium karelineae]|uniref:rhomboid family intramembrane serine protease n=1 Tax=Microbacterium karelineae TaxID=2654283 RepID=UPI0012EA04F9|nr:rhomboid family intramembrane serine protease [Microbacterium karelineae]